MVRGAPVPDLTTRRKTDLKLIFDRTVIDEWEALRWPDDILASVPWLVESLAEHNLGLKAGDMVLTSAWGPPRPLNDLVQVDVTSSAFGDVIATFNDDPVPQHPEL